MSDEHLDTGGLRLADARRRVEHARTLEWGLVKVRLVGVVLGAYLVWQTNTGDPRFFPPASETRIHIGYLLMAVLAIANIAIAMAVRRAATAERLQRIGLAAFAVDIFVVLSLAWLYSYDPRGSVWVVIYILPLEGAIRYGLWGALAAIFVSLLSEIGREAYLDSAFDGYTFQLANILFRVGIQTLIGIVAGFMARSLTQEAENAEEQARRYRDAARRESEARGELAAFNTAILTGVAAEDLDTSIQLMADAIGRDLGFESFTILLREGDDLVVKGMAGMPFYEDRIPLGTGVTGTVAAKGRPIVVNDVTSFPGYIAADPQMRSEMASPMRIGEDVIGVIDVESRRIDAFDEDDLATLTRLADQIALVAHSNQLLSQQRETMKRLQELDQMKSDFVAITSHELRTPITAIRGFVKTLLRNQDRLTQEQVANFMRIIDRQSSRLARLVEDLLLVSRIEAGTIRFAREEVELADVMRESIEAIGPEQRARIHLTVDGVAGPVVLDPHRFEQIVRNLVENALKFSPVEVAVDVRAGVRDGCVDLEVEDRGVGIPPEQLPYIFDRFHQVGEVMTREAEGAGLGLYITKRLVEAMGGSIEVASEPGVGSTFRVRIPAYLPVGDGAGVRLAGELMPGTSR